MMNQLQHEPLYPPQSPLQRMNCVQIQNLLVYQQHQRRISNELGLREWQQRQVSDYNILIKQQSILREYHVYLIHTNT